MEKRMTSAVAIQPMAQIRPRAHLMCRVVLDDFLEQRGS